MECFENNKHVVIFVNEQMPPEDRQLTFGIASHLESVLDFEGVRFLERLYDKCLSVLQVDSSATIMKPKLISSICTINNDKEVLRDILLLIKPVDLYEQYVLVIRMNKLIKSY